MNWKMIAPWNWFLAEESADRPAARIPRLAVSQDPMNALRAEMNRHFEDTVRRSFPSGALPSTSLRGTAEVFAPLRPVVDISESRKSYSVRIELPGVEPADVSLEIKDDNTLVLRAEKRREHQEDDEGVHWVESTYGAVQRVLSLPNDADADSAEAKFKNGVLRLRISKQEGQASKSRKIEIQQG